MRKTKIAQLVVLTALTLTFTSCGKPPTAGGPPPMKIPVVAYKAKRQPVSDKISLVGTLLPNEAVEIKSEVDGAIEEINLEEGQPVKQGDVLFRIDQKKLTASLDQAQANLTLAESTFNRYQTLVQSGAISQQEFDQASAAFEANRATLALTKEQLEDAIIVAPFDGIIGQRKVSVGQFITKGTMLTELVNQNPMKAEFHIPERYLSRIKENQEIEISVAAYPEEIFKGEVYFIDPTIDNLTRTALLKARLPNPEGKLRPGMFANLSLILNVLPDALLIPETAVVVQGDDNSVFVIDEQMTAHVRPIHIGLRVPGAVHVEEGIAEGESVVVEGYQKLGEGAEVEVTYIEELTAAHAHGVLPKI